MKFVLPVADQWLVTRAALKLIAADRRSVLAMVTVNSAAALAALGGPYLLGQIIDTVADGGGVDRVDRLALAVLCCAVAQMLLSRYAIAIAFRFGERTAARIREGFLRRALNLPAAVVERVPPGDLAARGTVDVDAVATSLREILPGMAVGAVQVLFIMSAVVVLDPLLGVVGLLGLSGIWFVTRWYLRRARGAYLTEGA
ncbi:MAG TPA: ABC transporter transmembrane domain-containing protein, partial [Actinoplanes sp.]